MAPSSVELRKLQRTGGSTHVLSLPKGWIDRNKLGRGDAISIHEEPDGSLLLVPYSEGRPQRRTVPIDLPDSCTPEQAVRRLVGAYLAGADEIHIRSSARLHPAVRRTLRALARDLVGVEILEETPHGIVLQDLVGVSEMDFRKTATRMHRIARLMFDDAMAALSTRDSETAQDVIGRDDELDRLEWMVSKQMHALLEQPRLAARMNARPAEALNYFLVARALERMGDHASKMCRNILTLGQRDIGTTVLDDMHRQSAAISRIWDDAFAAIRKPDFDLASKAADDGKAAAAWRASVPALLRHLPPAEVGGLTLIADSLDRTRGYAVDIAEVAMNHTFQRV
jgi:phosphate uptake regulator